MAKMNSYADYKSGTTSGEQEKLLETGKVLFSGKKTANGDPVTLSIPVSELVSDGGSDIPDVGSNTNRGKVLSVAHDSDEMVWEFIGNPLPLEYASAGYGVPPDGQDTRFRTDVLPNNTYYQIIGYVYGSSSTDLYIQLENSSVPCCVIEFDCASTLTTIHVLNGSTELTQVGSEFKPKSSGRTYVQVFVYGNLFSVKTSNLTTSGEGGGGGSSMEKASVTASYYYDPNDNLSPAENKWSIINISNNTYSVVSNTLPLPDPEEDPADRYYYGRNVRINLSECELPNAIVELNYNDNNDSEYDNPINKIRVFNGNTELTESKAPIVNHVDNNGSGSYTNYTTTISYGLQSKIQIKILGSFYQVMSSVCDVYCSY